ncbi:phosphatidylinositol mannoside acyltransferase, partial [Iamia sp.]|uniref:phosphatidylinositol mannoside acyltransferase n=1 Tax=Iamia sp. TaxID=2722710 RepID=UPI002C334CE9
RLASRRLVVERNLRRVHGPDLDGPRLAALVDATFASYAHYWIESFRLPGTSVADIDARMTAIGMAHIEAAMDAGRGCILALPHLGAWEWAAFWLAKVKGYPVTAVVEQIEPPELAAWFVGLRRQFGIEVVPFGPSAAAACAKALKAGHVLALLCDRDLAGTGIAVDFFGEPTTLPGGPATLALRTGAPLIPAAVTFDIDGGHLGVALPPLDTERRGALRADVARVTQDLAHALEVLIRRAPDQWHLLQPNWPSDHAALAAAGLAPAAPTS